MPERDEGLRASCFSHLRILEAEFGEELPYAAGLARGFPFRGERVPFLNVQKGIHRARVQRGPAALSIQTSVSSPYGDQETEEGFVYGTARARSTSLTTVPSAQPPRWASRSSTSSVPSRGGTGRSTPHT